MRAPAFAVVIAALTAAIAAQEQLRVQGPTPATVVLGSASRVDLVVEGRDADPEEPKVPNVPGLSVRVAGPSRQTYSSFGFGNNSTSHTVTWTLVLQPQQEGKFTVPAFVWKTGKKQQQVGPLVIEAVKELRGAEFAYLSVQFERTRVYVHEPIRARIEFGVDKGLRLAQGRASNGQPYYDVEVQAPWLSSMEGAEPLAEVDDPQQRAPIVLNQTLQFADADADHERGGKHYQSFTFQKAFLPTRVGKWKLDAPMLRYDVQLQQGRVGIFGERLGGQTQNYYVYGQPLELEVLPIPEQGRPSPYFGAVGRFAIDASADRDRVKVGNSVKVTFTIRGTGNLEFLRVPELETFEALGLHKLAQSKQKKDGAVIVTYDLTPLRADVKEIPPIEWNWFDTTPGVEKFVTAATKALPLTVQPLADGETLTPLKDDAKKAVVPGVDDIHDLPELAGAPVLRGEVAAGTAWLAVVGPWLALALLLAVRTFVRRRASDPLAVRARGAARACERALANGDEPLAAWTEYLGARLRVPAAAVIGSDLAARLRNAGFPDDVASDAAAAVDRGTAGRYGGGGGLDADAVRALVARCEPHAPNASGGARLLLFALLLAGASGALRAQDDAVAAYRKGDYAAAERAFAERFAATGDRRLWSARGNCFFRQGDLPRALWAYECARLGLPRDAELQQNLALVQKRLELGGDGGEPFAAALARLRDRCTAGELTLLCAFAMIAAAIALGLGWRRPALRWLGIVLLVPGALLALELLWLRPARPPAAIALAKLELSSEPRAGLPAVATVAAGARVELRSEGSGEWVRIDADGHLGYCKRELLGKIE